MLEQQTTVAQGGQCASKADNISITRAVVNNKTRRGDEFVFVAAEARAAKAHRLVSLAAAKGVGFHWQILLTSYHLSTTSSEELLIYHFNTKCLPKSFHSFGFIANSLLQSQPLNFSHFENMGLSSCIAPAKRL